MGSFIFEVERKCEVCGRLFTRSEYERYCSENCADDSLFNREDEKILNWIKHDGGECPIPWAKAGEFALKLENGDCIWPENNDAVKYAWDYKGFSLNIVTFHLRNGWIYVPGDGTIPEEIRGTKAGEWQFRLRCGDIRESMYDSTSTNKVFFTHDKQYSDIVAVRLVKQPSTLDNYLVTVDGEGIVSKEEVYFQEEYKRTDKLYKKVDSRATFETIIQIESEKRRLTREAWERYKMKNPTPEKVPLIGESVIEAYIFTAICEAMKK